MNKTARLGSALTLTLLIGACGSSDPLAGGDLQPTVPQQLDRRCDLAAFPSAEWTACELTNYDRTLEAPTEQVEPRFVSETAARVGDNLNAWLARAAEDPSWLSPLSANTAVTPVCSTGGPPCFGGDPFSYPQAAGADGQGFYETVAVVTPVVFYDRDCARLSGRVWLPKNASGRLPGVVITNGSFQAGEGAYWWAAQALVRNGYAVLTFDPRGQGLSDWQAPDLQQGGNINAKVFWEGQVDAIDFFRSSAAHPYPQQQACAGTYPTSTASFNPIAGHLDPERLGIAGHSLGAIGVSVVQGYGAEDADPWPGFIDEKNPVKAAVAWDSLITPAFDGFAPATNYPLPAELVQLVVYLGTQTNLPRFAPRAPALSFNADYGLAPTPYVTPPDPENHKRAFAAWQQAQVPAMVVSLAGTTHFDYSLTPLLPATSWCPQPGSGACSGGWGQPAIIHYTIAWFDRWLKRSGEPGYADADARLLDDAGPEGAVKFSFRYRSARDFPDRGGHRQHCEDIRRGCDP